MKRIMINIVLIFIINILFISPGYGKGKEEKQNYKFGLGVAIERGSKIYFPISITPKIRLEPEISFNQNSYKKNDFESKYVAINVGMGILSLVQTDHFTTYYGLRFGYTNTSKINEYDFPTREGVSKDKQDGFYISPVGGGEYSFANRFSIGPEVSVNYSNTRGTETNDDQKYKSSSNSLRVSAGILLRFYFK